jgi:hypothetical protein
VRQSWEEKGRAREEEMAQLEAGLVEEFGSRNSKWEVLWDPKAMCVYHYHIETGEAAYGDTVGICEKCDTRLLPEDARCTTCRAARSAKNRKLYRGIEGMQR